ncbi:hypothetical protein K7X08_026258 [Anisodus acutangulus]|uniref:Uncharacterized protein n=1 Tax=Anisodus acutangulus TaxID=402998 RepID=A0A9Q1N5X9_9SOLA|nr:hypothetical protein K7X08_026258 [Anisodus acutangulus]
MPGLKVKMWYVPELELPEEGYVMKGATLVVIKPVEEWSKADDGGDSVAKGFGIARDGKEEKVFDQVARELVKYLGLLQTRTDHLTQAHHKVIVTAIHPGQTSCIVQIFTSEEGDSYGNLIYVCGKSHRLLDGAGALGIGYSFYYKRNIRSPDKEFERLENIRNGVQRGVEAARRNLHVISPNVEAKNPRSD